MKKFLLLVAIATLSSVAYGQMTEVFRVINSSMYMYGWESAVCNQYVIVQSGNTLTYYDADDFSVAHTLTISDVDVVMYPVCIPRGVYARDNNDYCIIVCNNYDGSDYHNNISMIRVYNLDNGTLVETPLSIASPDGISLDENGPLFRRGSEIYLRVYYMDNSGCAYNIIYKFSGTISSNVSQPHADKDGLAAYPNPSRDKITLAYQTTTTATSIRICDVNGRLVERIPVNSNSGEYTLNVSNYPEGVYFYEINGKSSSFMVK